MHPIIMTCYMIDLKIKCRYQCIIIYTIQICWETLNGHKKQCTIIGMGMLKQEMSMSCKDYYL